MFLISKLLETHLIKKVEEEQFVSTMGLFQRIRTFFLFTLRYTKSSFVIFSGTGVFTDGNNIVSTNRFP